MANRNKIVYHTLLFIFLILVTRIVHGAEARNHSIPERALAEPSVALEDVAESSFLVKFVKSLKGSSSHSHVWPDMGIRWRMIVGTVIAFTGAAFGSAGGVGAGGIFVPMLTLIVGFDAKSSTAISKCMIMGLSATTFYFNRNRRHPTLDLPLIDYKLALLLQPMLLLGISTGVILNVIFANWMITILLIIAFVGTSIRSFFKGVEMWKKETIQKKEAAKQLKSGQIVGEIEYKPLPGGPTEQPRASVTETVNRKQFIVLVSVWLAFLAIRIFKDWTTTCSVTYWILNLLQIPVAVGVTLYWALRFYRGSTEINNTTDEVGAHSMSTQQLVFCSFASLLAGTLGGLLGLGGGSLLNPMFLEIGIIPEVSSATATFVMMFSSSMCVMEYYLLNRFPIPYAVYLIFIAIVASCTGQYVVRSWITRAGRASLIVFILSSIIFASAILLGGEGIVDMIYQIRHNEYMGFEDLCTT